MDLLRRMFGLQSVSEEEKSPVLAKPVDLEGPTAPLASAKVAMPIDIDLAEPVDLNRTDLLDDDNHSEIHTRRLSEMDIAAYDGRSTRQLIYGIHSDPGQVRSNNQDAVFSFLSSSISVDEHPNFGLFIVADGMGGHHDGEKASSLAARTIVQYVSNEIYLPMLEAKETNAERPTITEILRLAIQKANEMVSSHVPEGGTTVTAAAIMGDLTYIGHVGDSRAYIINTDGIEQLTRDHSLVQRLIELDQLTPEEAADHPQRNVLYRAIGQNESIDVDAVTRRLPPGSRLLLCSDGLWNMVSVEEIRNTVSSTPSPQTACETLVKLSNERGGPDNISVIIVRMPEK